MIPCMLSLCLAAGAYAAIDGDTLRRSVGPDVRIWGIDAPEWDDPAGAAATDNLRSLTDGQPLACEPMDQDHYGRVVARCYLPDKRDLACEMVAAGHAEDWPRYSGGTYAGCGGGDH